MPAKDAGGGGGPDAGASLGGDAIVSAVPSLSAGEPSDHTVGCVAYAARLKVPGVASMALLVSASAAGPAFCAAAAARSGVLVASAGVATPGMSSGRGASTGTGVWNSPLGALPAGSSEAAAGAMLADAARCSAAQRTKGLGTCSGKTSRFCSVSRVARRSVAST